ncbi:MAG: TetR/AcrR family transcriptional regulator [Prevotellaceae bacterium]|jgi:AcrR family transcriptional regulator|nr:TetR/AcrR family transcriptional regulator [Prevotellaceae bacterium]
MTEKDLSTEAVILDATEAEFLEKGFGSTKMMAIAKRAGVSHSMLHYYFRTKENLFRTIFLKKIQILSQACEAILVQHLPFAGTIRLIVESQFNFVRQNPQLPYFVLNEILSNKENRALVLKLLRPKIMNIFDNIEKILSVEIEKGAIRPVKIRDFMMNMISLNISTFVALPILQEIVNDEEMLDSILNERRESNVQFILNALKP